MSLGAGWILMSWGSTGFWDVRSGSLEFEVCRLRARGLESGDLRPRPETHGLGRHEGFRYVLRSEVQQRLWSFGVGCRKGPRART